MGRLCRVALVAGLRCRLDAVVVLAGMCRCFQCSACQPACSPCMLGPLMSTCASIHRVQAINNNMRCYDESLEFAEALEERFAEHIKGGSAREGLGGNKGLASQVQCAPPCRLS